MFGRDGELAVDRQDEQRIEFSGANKLGKVGHIHEEEGLEKLCDHLVRADEEDDFPFCPIPNSIDLTEDDAEKNDLPAKPQDLDHHPKNEVRLETQLPDEGVAQHDRINL